MTDRHHDAVAHILRELVPRIPMRHKATITYHPEALWFKYVVHRTHGMAIPENGVRCFHTFKRAARCKARWEANDLAPQPFVIHP